MAPLKTFLCCSCGSEFSYFTEYGPIKCPKCKTVTAFYEKVAPVAEDYSLPLDERIAATKGLCTTFISEHPTMQK